jgi:hypothetical protein
MDHHGIQCGPVGGAIPWEFVGEEGHVDTG